MQVFEDEVVVVGVGVSDSNWLWLVFLLFCYCSLFIYTEAFDSYSGGVLNAELFAAEVVVNEM